MNILNIANKHGELYLGFGRNVHYRDFKEENIRKFLNDFLSYAMLVNYIVTLVISGKADLYNGGRL